MSDGHPKTAETPTANPSPGLTAKAGSQHPKTSLAPRPFFPVGIVERGDGATVMGWADRIRTESTLTERAAWVAHAGKSTQLASEAGVAPTQLSATLRSFTLFQKKRSATAPWASAAAIATVTVRVDILGNRARKGRRARDVCLQRAGKRAM